MKIRLFNKKEKEMIYTENIDDFMFLTLDGSVVIISFDRITGTFSECDVTENYILMESSTLLDNECREIYQGDIVKYNELELEIIKDIFGWYGRYWIDAGTDLKSEDIPLKDFWFNCTIIGDVYNGSR